MDQDAGNGNSPESGTSGGIQSAHRHRPRWWDWPIRLILLIALGVFLFSLLGRFSYVAELMGNFRIWWLGLLGVALGLAMLVRWWRWSLVLAMACGWASLGTITPWLPLPQPPPGEERLTILTFNVRGDNQRFEEVKAQIREIDPDVLIVPEFTVRWKEELAELNDVWPYQVVEPRWHGFGIALFSKRPIVASTTHQLTSDLTDNPVVEAELELDGRPVRILGLHLFSPTNLPRMRLRNAQLKELPTIVRSRELPTVVAGDFNCTPWSPPLFRCLSRSGLRDSRQGFGYQASWHARMWPLFIPIDHFFLSREWHVHRRRVEDDRGGSDHLPVLIEISLAPERGGPSR